MLYIYYNTIFSLLKSLIIITEALKQVRIFCSLPSVDHEPNQLQAYVVHIKLVETINFQMKFLTKALISSSILNNILTIYSSVKVA